jgi:hypothetical protein
MAEEFSSGNIPLGIRQNNPCNIVHNPSSPWKNEILPPVGRFASFTTPVYGLRAAMLLIRNYFTVHGLNTVEQIIDRWAPPVENDTGSYVRDIADRMNVSAAQVLTPDQQTITTMTESIVVHENGHPPVGWAPYWYNADVYVAAWEALP